MDLFVFYDPNTSPLDMPYQPVGLDFSHLVPEVPIRDNARQEILVVSMLPIKTGQSK